MVHVERRTARLLGEALGIYIGRRCHNNEVVLCVIIPRVQDIPDMLISPQRAFKSKLSERFPENTLMRVKNSGHACRSRFQKVMRRCGWCYRKTYNGFAIFDRDSPLSSVHGRSGYVRCDWTLPSGLRR